jgi:hypothetical protein
MEDRRETRSAEARPTDLVQRTGQGQPAVVYEIHRIKPLAQLRASDVPMGMDPYDLATDFSP